MLENNSSASTVSTIVSQSIQSYMAENDFLQVAGTVRTNANGYPFVTFINSANQAENVYMSKKLGDTLAGTPINKAFFAQLQIVHVTNAAGESRVKLSGKGESTRVESTDLF